jgi:S-DNA-T family DNA segregation ATPase FtsK/SpoIIIE
MQTTPYTALERLPEPARDFMGRRFAELAGVLLMLLAGALLLSLASWSAQDPSLTFASDQEVQNWLGKPGAVVADLLMQIIGLAAIGFLIPVLSWGWRLITKRAIARFHLRAACWILGTITMAAFLSLLPSTERWPLPTGMGGVVGDAMLFIPKLAFGTDRLAMVIGGIVFAVTSLLLLKFASSQTVHVSGRSEDNADPIAEPKRRRMSKGLEEADEPVVDPHGEPTYAIIIFGALAHSFMSMKAACARTFYRKARTANLESVPKRIEPKVSVSPTDRFQPIDAPDENDFDCKMEADEPDRNVEQIATYTRSRQPVDIIPDAPDEPPAPRITPAVTDLKPGKRIYREAQPTMWSVDTFELPPLLLLAEPKRVKSANLSTDALEQNARLLEGVLEDFGVRGEIINVRPGPVVTLYELEPAPGVKSSRVIGLAEDIARSMSAISARVAVVSGRNAIGIELPNQKRETVFLRELLASETFERSKHKLAICLGKTIGGEPVITDLAKMPHLLVAGTTGSGKSVAINTMILSLLYRLNPDQCKLIMIDPKMLELSVYDGIPHLLTPVVTDPKKAVVALKWAVREMEDRYQKMSKLGVRNIEGFNNRVADAKGKGKTITRTVQTGFDRETGEAIFEEEEFDLNVLPFIVIIVDEMADLMMVAGKDIEGAIQRLAQMARAAGIHIIMATQRPSVDVITGTIKANFPTRISFQVTSKIDSRTILGEQGAEQLLGQGDMLYMAGGGRISRVHGPFVADDEVEDVVAHLKQQGQPEYLEAITLDDDDDDGEGKTSGGLLPGSMDEEEAMSLYDRAVAIVLRDRKCSTSYIQRRLSVGYNKAASLVEQMEDEGVVSPANHAGKREILVGNGVDRGAFEDIDAN